MYNTVCRRPSLPSGMATRLIAAARLGLALSLILVAPLLHAGSDADGVPDLQDCSPLDPTIAAPVTYYFDADGDQFGEAAEAVSLCQLTPFPGTVPQAGDFNDLDPIDRPRSVARGDRVFALDFLDGAESSGWRVDLARELGAGAAHLKLRWSDLETVPGVFDGPLVPILAILRDTYVAQDFSLSLTLAAIDRDTLTVPADLATPIANGVLSMDAATVTARYAALMDFVASELPGVSLVGLQVGDEIDRYVDVETNTDFWGAALPGFVINATNHARSIWGDTLSVGATVTHTGALSTTVQTTLLSTWQVSGHVGLSFTPRGADFRVPSPVAAAAELASVLATLDPITVHVVRAAYPSSPATGSATTAQSQFITALFGVWDAYKSRVPLLALGPLFDASPAAAAGLAAAGYLNVAPEDLPRAEHYFSSLGVREYFEAGPEKPAYVTLRTQALNRGWWNALPRTSRKFLLAATNTPHDLPTAEVLEDLTADADRFVDVYFFHFDKGVPWSEALTDDLSSAELPYSNSVRELWENYRATAPAGTSIGVSINALGIPREILAPYWGVGESYVLDENLVRQGTGVVDDDDQRLLLPPFDTAEFNDPVVKTAFVNYAKRVIDFFQPDYLVISVEANLGIVGGQTTYDKIVELYAHVYNTLKADPIADGVQLVISFTGENLLNDELGVPLLVENIQDPTLEALHTGAIEALIPYTDIVGISLYPHKSRFRADLIPSEVVKGLLSTIREMTPKPLAITETGFPADSFLIQGFPFDSTPEKQAIYQRLLMEDVAKFDNVEFVTNFLVRDNTPQMDRLRAQALVDPAIDPALIEFFRYFEFTGLTDQNGVNRPGTEVWNNYFALPVVRDTAWIDPIELTSPDGRVRATFGVDANGRLMYAVSIDGTPVVMPSRLGLIVDGEDLGTQVVNLTVSPTTASVEQYPARGRTSLLTDNHNSTSLTVRRGSAGDTSYKLEVRAFDTGIAFRHVVPGSGMRTINGESTSWTLPDPSEVWLNTETDNYEGELRVLPAGLFKNDLAPPITARVAGNAYVSITEASLINWSGMTLEAELGSRVLKSEFLDDASWPAPAGSVSPWRVTMTGTTLDALAGGELVSHLSDPPDPALFPQGADTPWIKRGRSVWSWWSDAISGGNFDVQRQYIDYAHQLGFEYVLVDAWWEQGFPTAGTTALERLAELVDYAHADDRNVDIWVWKNWYELIDPVTRSAFLDAVTNAGVVGVKIDNVAADNSESVFSNGLYRTILTEAAERRLMVNFHGVNKATGSARTFPNEITREGALGLENNGLLWPQGIGVSPRHNAAQPFVRQLAGPFDYTPLTLDERKIANTTFAHQLAMFGVNTSPLQHMADDPSVVLAHPELIDVLTALPTEWDETRVLPGSGVGQLAAFARRAGDIWVVVALNGDEENPATLPVDVSFLGDRNYSVIVISDDTQTSVNRQEYQSFTGSDALTLDMLPGGGATALFRPADRKFLLGISTWPISPTLDDPAVDGLVQQASDIVAHVLLEGVPWPEALASTNHETFPAAVQAQWNHLRDKQQTLATERPTYLVLHPYDLATAGLAGYWGSAPNQPLPIPWNGLSLQDADVASAFGNYAEAAIRFFSADYVAIGIDVNVLLSRAPTDWQAVKAFHDSIYQRLKGEFPEVRVFPLLNYEHLIGTAPEADALQSMFKVSYPDVLTRETQPLLESSDLLALTTYPWQVGTEFADSRYWDPAQSLSRRLELPIAWHFSLPAAPVEGFIGSVAGQESQIAGILETAQLEGNTEFLLNWSARDVADTGLTENVIPLAASGFFDANGVPRPALDIWVSYLDLDLDLDLNTNSPFPGSLIAVSSTDTGVDLSFSSNATARIEFLAEDVFRIRMNPTGSFRDWATGAIDPASPLAADASVVTVVDEGERVYLSSSELTVIVELDPFQVSAWRTDGSLILTHQPQVWSFDESSGTIQAEIAAPADAEYYGLGLRGGPMNRRGDVFVMRNTDNGAYGEFSQPLYSTTPFYYGKQNGRFHGVFFDNAAQAYFDMDSSGDGALRFGAVEGELDYYVFAGPEPKDVAESFAALTGRTPLPALWTLGFQQSRYGYASWTELINLAQTFRNLSIPSDVLYLDLDYLDNLNFLSWNPVTFPDPVTNNQVLEDMDFKRVNIIDPVLHEDDPLYPFMDGSDYFLKDAAGNTLVNNIFFGDVSWIDFSDPDLQDWLAGPLTTFIQTGISGVWNDLNEPAQNFMPEAVYDFDGQNRSDIQARNIYALIEVPLTREALLSARPNERPFILSRSGYPGIQRYAANWSGDGLSTFEALRVAIQQSVHMSLSGQNVFGHDVGGFLGAPGPELFVRWLEFASMTTFFRNHAVNTAPPREPWAFGEPYTSLSREVINKRYQWLPMWYTLMERTSRTGEPVLAPLFFHYPDDNAAADQVTEYLIGDSLLVAPVFVEGALSRDTYLPDPSLNWYHLATGTSYPGGSTISLPAPLGEIPVLARGGSLLVTGPVRQHVDDTTAPALTVDVFPGAPAEFELYEDDGLSFDYQSGRYLRTKIWTDSSTAATLNIQGTEGTFDPADRPWTVRYWDTDAPVMVTMNSAPLAEVVSRAALEATGSGWYYDAAKRQLEILTPPQASHATIDVLPLF